MSKPLAFIVDDDKSLGEAYRQALEISGFTAIHIYDSTQAIALIVEQKPDVIMLDMQMPKINGAEILQAIRSDPQTEHIKVIVATASSHMLDSAVNELADLVLQKPVSLAQIMQFAKRILD